MDTRQISESINLVFQILMLMLPIAAALIVWFLRTYVRSTKAEKTLATIVRVSNAAIDFAEDLDQRGELAKYLKAWNVPDDMVGVAKNGLKKIQLAGHWAESEFARLGIKLSNTEAQAWIAAEYQRRQGGAGPEQPPTERTAPSASPSNVIKPGDLMGSPPGVQTPPAGPPPDVSAEAELAQLAAQAVHYVEQLKTGQQIDVPVSEVASGYVQIEVARQRLKVTEDQIASAVATAIAANKAGQPIP